MSFIMDPDGESLFLSDRAISDVDEDQFGHAEYVDSLENMLKEAEPPWHIGIFGEWGSGKSSIIKMLFTRLRGDSEFDDTIFVEFDAWSHAEESIRTELLIELDQKIGGEESDGVLGEDEITGRLYDVEEEKVKKKRSGLWKSFIDVITTDTYLVAIIASLVVISSIAAFAGYPEISIGVLTLILAPLLVTMAEKLSEATETLQRKFLYPRKEWSGAYQRIFEDIIDESGAEKVVISIDNLDRCQSEVVLDVLVSMKTFMEHDKCIYLIPCDDRALESHIRAIDDGDYFKQVKNEKEFLRKFFQTHIRIPPFLPEDIEKYAESENSKLKKKFSPETLDVLTNAYIDNPRRIKHALNRLTTLQILAEEIEETGDLVPGRITGNLPFLAKVSILEEEYPKFYEEVSEDPHLFGDIYDYFSHELVDSGKKTRVENLLKQEDSEDNEGESRLEAFLRSTRRIRADDPRPFLNLSEPSYSTSVSGMDAFLQNLRTGQEEEVRDQLEKAESFDPYVNAIEPTIEEYTVQRREQPLFGTIDTVVEVFDLFDEDAQEQVAETLGEYMTTDPGRGFLIDLNPDKMFPILSKMDTRHASILFTKYADLVIQDEELRSNLLETFTEYPSIVPSSTAKRLNNNIEGLGDDTFKDALKILNTSHEVKSKYTYTSTLKRAASLVELEDNQNEYQDTEHYTEFDNVASQTARSAYVDRLLELRTDYEGNDAQSMDEEFSERLTAIKPEIDSTSAGRLLEVIQGLSEDRSNEQPIELVEPCFHFYDSFSEETKAEFHEWLTEPLSSWNVSNIEELFELALKNDVEIYSTEQEVEVVLDRIPDNISQEDFIKDVVVSGIPDQFDKLLVNKIRELVAHNNTNTNRLGVEIFSRDPKRFDSIWGDVIETCGDHATNTNNQSHKQEYMTVGADLYSEMDGPLQESYISQMGRLLSGDRDDYKLYQELWSQIQAKTDTDRRETIAADVREEVIDAINGNQNPNHVEPLIQVLQSVAEDMSDQNGQSLMERLSKQLTENKLNDKRKSTVIDQIAGFDEYFGKENQILDRIENLLSQTNNSSVNQSAETLVTKLDERNQVNDEQVEEIREEYFGD